MLNLPDALEVYGICRSCIDDKEILSDSFLASITSQLHHDEYFRLLELLSKKSTDDLVKLNALDLVEILINGLNENEIRSLYAFCKEIL